MEDIQLLNMLEARTGAKGTDVVRAEGGFTFIVERGELGKAIGKQGANLARLRKETNANVEIVEASDTIEGFTRNVFRPAILREINVINDGKTVSIKVDREEKGKAIGRNGDKIKRARTLLKRCYGIEEVKLT